MTPTLSILIPTVTPARDKYLSRLMECIDSQVRLRHRMETIAGISPRSCVIESEDGTVEIVIEADAGHNNGGAPTGHKRNIATEKSTGAYIMNVDDDDLLFPGAIQRILEAIEVHTAEKGPPDCVGLEGLMVALPSRDIPLPPPTKRFVHSVRYHCWYERDNVLYRPPNHLNPIRREIALKVPYRQITFGEDRAFSCALRPLLGSEVMLDGAPIYKYLFRQTKFELNARV